MKLFSRCLQISHLCAACNNTVHVCANNQLQVWTDLNERAIAFPMVTLEIPNDTETVQAVTEILLLTEQNKALVSH